MIRFFALLFVLATLAPDPALAADDMPVLFVSPQQRAEIEQHRASRVLEDPSLCPYFIRLGALMYQSPEQWRVFINGQWVGPHDAADPRWRILSVEPQTVTLEIPATGRQPQAILSLQTQDTYHLLTRSIVQNGARCGASP